MLFINIGKFELIFILLTILSFWIYTFYHIAKNKALSNSEKNLWYLIVLLGNGFGILVYWIFGKKHK